MLSPALSTWLYPLPTWIRTATRYHIFSPVHREINNRLRDISIFFPKTNQLVDGTAGIQVHNCLTPKPGFYFWFCFVLPSGCPHTFPLHFLMMQNLCWSQLPFCPHFWSQSASRSQAYASRKTTEVSWGGHVADRSGHVLVNSPGRRDSWSAFGTQLWGQNQKRVFFMPESHGLMPSHGLSLDPLEPPAWEKLKEIRFPEHLQASW